MGFQTVSIKDNASGQVIRIPDNLRIEDDRVYLKKVGNTIYLIPFHDPWSSLMDSLEKFSDDFMDNREQSEGQSREAL